jgi:hypothetical protein
LSIFLFFVFLSLGRRHWRHGFFIRVSLFKEKDFKFSYGCALVPMYSWYFVVEWPCIISFFFSLVLSCKIFFHIYSSAFWVIIMIWWEEIKKKSKSRRVFFICNHKWHNENVVEFGSIFFYHPVFLGCIILLILIFTN